MLNANYLDPQDWKVAHVNASNGLSAGFTQRDPTLSGVLRRARSAVSPACGGAVGRERDVAEPDGLPAAGRKRRS